MATALPFNFTIGRRLRPKYVYLLVLLPVLCIIGSLFVLWPIGMWLASALGIPPDVPVREQANGWLWFGLFCVALALLVTIGNVVGYLLNAAVAAVAGWSREKIVAVFLRSEVPDHWLLPAGGAQDDP